MSNENNITEKTLRYIHGEMSDAELREFEAILKLDPSLQKTVAEDRSIFERSKPLRGIPGGQWDKLVDHILKEMDPASSTALKNSEEPGIIIPFPAKASGEKPAHRRRFPGIVLAAAAALLLLFLIPRWLLSPLSWQAPLIDQSSALRDGGDQETVFQRYTEQDFQKAFGRFQESMNRTYRHRDFKSRPFSLLPRREWKLSTSIREMRAGRVAISVTAVHPDGTGTTKEWTEYYRNLEAWGADADALSQRIAGELGELHGHE
ncbi:MAG TPA: hypothetical protein DCZ95_11695 [Verrucomicrobia bacterium]|nr:MAG: hypothetical protein A2X46_01730 [Lentisphaerae bacterium GWF2_57_35]HBA84748.1 hypothetical protein [Verrucomicrobiota bacterium]